MSLFLKSFARPVCSRAGSIYVRNSSVQSNVVSRTFATTKIRQVDPYSDVKVTDRFSLKGKTILVTGGARGLGFAMSKAIAQLGGNIAILDSLPEPVEEFHTLADKHNITAVYEQTDVTSQSSLESAFASVVKQTGGLNGCITAAGIALDAPFLEQPWDICQKILAVNVMGTFWTAKLVAQHLIERKQGGSMVFIASVAAQGLKVPLQTLAIYNMSKAGVKGLVGPLAVELGEAGIRVNSISPGVIASPMTDGMIWPALDDMFNNAAPMKRKGRPSDLTPTATFLLSDASEYTTGADFLITGGLHAGVSPSWLNKT
ncbi:hypothetical protein B0A48_06138 [Cryoendolithus antarcticus]|uniref:Uncharacterized protein n=1 Tax=Cryoendolithus antarcticus TaxID=1507870 RepID=A0A1V8TAL2_9PEZI|nr:hypothetical protein B0A48_06138 [Cryoendolithus antarcticus]